MSIFKRKKAIKIGIVSYSSSEMKKPQSTIASYISDHSQAFKSVMDYLSGKYELETVLTEDLQDYERLFKKYIRILILPEIAVITQQQLNNLEAFVRFGGIVLADYPSFAYERVPENDISGRTHRKIVMRLRNLFGIDEAKEAVVSVKVYTQLGGWHNFFKGAPSYVPYNGEAILIRVSNRDCTTHGNLHLEKIEKIEDNQGEWRIEELREAGFPCLLYKSYDYRGYFLYSTIPLCRNLPKLELGSIFNELVDIQETAVSQRRTSRTQKKEIPEQLDQDLKFLWVLSSISFVGVVFILSHLFLPKEVLSSAYERLIGSVIFTSIVFFVRHVWKRLKAK